MGNTITPVRPLKVEASKKIQGPDLKITDERKGDNQKEIEPIANLKESHKRVRESSEATVKRTAEALEDYAKSMKRDLKIQVHGPTGNIIVKVISEKDGRVIREIPPEEWLNLAAKMEDMAGVLLNKMI
jgi:flagellar protein FlaG